MTLYISLLIYNNVKIIKHYYKLLYIEIKISNDNKIICLLFVQIKLKV